MNSLRTTLFQFDVRLTRLTARHAIALLRVSLGLVYLWFGALKFFPGMSPAQDLAGRTIASLCFGLVPAENAVPLLAAFETAIGLALISGRWLRLTLLLLLGQMGEHSRRCCCSRTRRSHRFLSHRRWRASTSSKTWCW